MTTKSWRLVFSIEVKATGVDPRGREMTPAWMAASAHGLCEKIFRASNWAPFFENKRDAMAAADLLAEGVPEIIQTRIVQKRHAANRTLWPKLNRLLDSLEELGNGALDGWPVSVCREFAHYATPMLEAALVRMRQRLAEATP